MDRVGFRQVFETWVRVGGRMESSVPQLIADMSYSDLLARLCAGEDPLPYPPPLLWGVPCAKFCDGEKHEVRQFEVGPDEAWITIGGFTWSVVRYLETGLALLSYDQRSPFFFLDTRRVPYTLQVADPKNWWRL